MKVCAAQIKCKAGDIDANIKTHSDYIKKAISNEFNVIVFPELSLTGYEPSLAKKLSIELHDSRLKVFQQLSDDGNIIICVGAPTKSASNIHISMLIFSPKKKLQIYSKQLIHESECPFFKAGTNNLTFKSKSITINPAICFESLQDSHAKQAKDANAQLYLASVAKTKEGILKAKNHYPKIAKQHGFYVVMANCIGKNDSLICEGQSGIWDKQGNCLRMLNSNQTGLIGFDTNSQETFSII